MIEGFIAILLGMLHMRFLNRNKTKKTTVPVVPVPAEVGSRLGA
jgi:hypothetical protein